MPVEEKGVTKVDIPEPEAAKAFSFRRQRRFQHFTQSYSRFCKILLIQGSA